MLLEDEYVITMLVYKAILSKSAQEVTMVVLFSQCANHRVNPMRLPDLLALECLPLCNVEIPSNPHPQYF